MSNRIGNHVVLTLFGESHGPAIGGVLDGMPAGIKVDFEEIQAMLEKRRAVGAISTSRKEEDIPEFLSGLKDGYTEGTSIAFVIRNTNRHSKDYESLKHIARPGHADYTGHIHYCGFEDPAGGGHFSGRLTAVMTVAGALCMSYLKDRGITIGTHIASLHGIPDRPFDFSHCKQEIALLNEKIFAVLDETKEEQMKAEILAARQAQDSVGGILETVVDGLEPGLGEPEFDSVESMLAHAMFSIPAVKGIEFGEGFQFANLYGHEANDPFCMEDGHVVTTTNHNGGINGGITNGMPVVFRTVLKPTPSIARPQKTVNFETMENTEITIQGRHDPAVIHRARVVVDAMTALTCMDLLVERYGLLGERK